jgi:hypothetical protein
MLVERAFLDIVNSMAATGDHLDGNVRCAGEGWPIGEVEAIWENPGNIRNNVVLGLFSLDDAWFRQHLAAEGTHGRVQSTHEFHQYLGML